ncbi:MAG: glycoside hydrolase family 88 protein [Acidimicrobiales bacterium]
MKPSDRELLCSVADTLPRLAYETWGFGDSVAFDAMIEASTALDDPSYVRFAHGWARSWATRAVPFRRLDCTAPGRAMVAISRRYSDARLLAALVALADYLLSRPRIGGVFATWEQSPLMRPYGPEQLDPRGEALLAARPAGVFVDCLHFDPPFLAALGVACGTEAYWRAGLEQARGYVELLQRPSGLFDHFVLEGESGSFGPGWGRGQGWALLGLLEVLAAVQDQLLDDTARESAEICRGAAAALVAAMINCQRDDGHWAAVVDCPRSEEEYSTAAFMAHGVARALSMGVVNGSAARKCAQRAFEAVRNAINTEGRLEKVSAAVMACTEASHYEHVPVGFLVPWGQGPAVLALVGAEESGP